MKFHDFVHNCFLVNEAPRELMTPVECGGTMDGCRELIAVWSIGGIGTCQNQNAGYLVGANKGLKYAVMQVCNYCKHVFVCLMDISQYLKAFIFSISE
jgi:hypothetical protein